MKRLLMLGSGSSTSTLSIRLLALARHLGGDWDVTMMLPSADKYNDFKPNKRAKVAGARLVQPWQFTTRVPLLNLIPYLFTSLFAALRARPDVVYLYKPTPITMVGLVPRLLFRTPVVLDMDDLGSQVMKREGRPFLEYALVAACESLAMRFANVIVVASSGLAAACAAQVGKKPVIIVPNGVEPDDYKPVRRRVLRQHVYYFGAVNSLDLVEDLLRATPQFLKSSPQAEVTIIGGGSALKDAKKLARTLGVHGSVSFTGWVDMLKAQRYTHYADVAVCYQPNTQTVRMASNMKVFQYMAMRSAVVVSDVGDLSAYVKNGSAGVAVKPGSADALAKSISELLGNHAKREALANAGYELAHGAYSWKQRAVVVNDTLQKLVFKESAS